MVITEEDFGSVFFAPDDEVHLGKEIEGDEELFFKEMIMWRENFQSMLENRRRVGSLKSMLKGLANLTDNPSPSPHHEAEQPLRSLHG